MANNKMAARQYIFDLIDINTALPIMYEDSWLYKMYVSYEDIQDDNILKEEKRWSITGK